VKSLWRDRQQNSYVRSDRDGNFWKGNIQDFWNEIAQTAALGHHLNLPQSARLFALLNISLGGYYNRIFRR